MGDSQSRTFLNAFFEELEGLRVVRNQGCQFVESIFLMVTVTINGVNSLSEIDEWFGTYDPE